MAKNETANNALEKANKAQDNLDIDNVMTGVNDLINDFSQVDTKQLQGLTADYMQFKEDTTYNMAFTRMTKFTGEKGGEIDAVELIDGTGKKWINGNTVLVNSLKKVQALPCLVRVITGKYIKSSSGSGKYLDMEVLVLSKVANAEI